MQEETKFGIWSDSNYLAFVISGKKMWRSIYHDYVADQGDILFIKKGANLTHQFSRMNSVLFSFLFRITSLEPFFRKTSIS